MQRHLRYRLTTRRRAERPDVVFEDLNLSDRAGELCGGAGAQRLRQIRRWPKHFNADPAALRAEPCHGLSAWTRQDEEQPDSPSGGTVGMVFQNPDNQIVANVVEEDVAFAPENLGVPSQEIRQACGRGACARWACTSTGSMRRICSPAGKSSGWPLQESLPCGRKCIVLDEPTAMLDPRGRREVLEIVSDLNRRLGHHCHSHHPPHG